MNALLRPFREGSVLLAIGMFLVLAVMLVPVPTPLLDLAITFNIAFTLTVLLVTLYTREPLEFSVFPTLLLVLTTQEAKLGLVFLEMKRAIADLRKVL